jgi:tetratricopeptide (TPR) repeat protein
MKKYFLFLGLIIAVYVQAQEQTAKLLQETARTLVQKGDYDNACIVLERAKAQEPDNAELLRDLVFAYYLKRDFAKAIETGRSLIEKPTADQQSYQVLGLAYKAIADYKECGKLYRAGLRKFPNSGVLYNEYGELFALEGDLEEAIVQWEKGIEADANQSGNYYNAAMYYGKIQNWIRSALYGELFLNLESYSARTTDIKAQLFQDWKNLLLPGTITKLTGMKNISAFEKQVLTLIDKAREGKTETGTEVLLAVRARFTGIWAKEGRTQYPFQLFDQQNYLQQQGLLDAYNVWLIAPPAELEAWQKAHPKESNGFTAYQQSRVYKQPAGQYYFGK